MQYAWILAEKLYVVRTRNTPLILPVSGSTRLDELAREISGCPEVVIFSTLEGQSKP